MVLYKVLNVNGKELKLRLRSRDCVDLERKLGESPLNILMKVSKEQKVPTVGFIVAVLYSSLQAYEHGYTMDKTYDLYDEYVDDGNEITDALNLITDVFEVSGFFKKAKTEEENVEEKAEETLQENQTDVKTLEELQITEEQEQMIIV